MKRCDRIDHNILPQPNIDKNLEELAIVRLLDPSSSNSREKKAARSGLAKIYSLKGLQREEKKLKRNFKFSIGTSSETNDIHNEILQQAKVRPIVFCDAGACVQYVSSCGHNSVILILCDYYGQNKMLVSQFKKLPQIILLYRCITQAELKKRWSAENQFFLRDRLPRSVVGTNVTDLDEASQLLLMQIFLTEFIAKYPRDDKAKADFIAFCHSTYKDHEKYATYKQQIEEFNRTYNENDAVKWYTKANSFIFRLVSKTCATADFAALIKIRFFLRDLYVQLQELHKAQLETLLKKKWEVYRGKVMSKEELSRLKQKGELFITRHFVSTSTEKDVATMFLNHDETNENNVSVLLSMQLEPMDIEDKPIALIKDLSSFPDEDEMMLSMGIVLRSDSYEEVEDNSPYSVKINMVRGKDEREIEKNLSKHLFTTMGASCSALSPVTFLESIQDDQHHRKYSKRVSDALKASDPQPAEKILAASNNNTEFKLVS